ncbi:hypothetical protein SAMN04488577_2963 [Bacillus sp. cl95]|nr:hypothetical protein SAMN02799634_105158 [Bacillus sp. UNCCL13]SFQ87135.1 hypothetical protein SAMN04488577_2963 [Bacillus sp. cl95]
MPMVLNSRPNIVYLPFYSANNNSDRHPYYEGKWEKEASQMGKTKLGNKNAQANNNVKKGKTSSELVEFTTGQENVKRNRPND